VERLGWHVQRLLDIEDFPDFDRIAARFPTQIVADHMGRPIGRTSCSIPRCRMTARSRTFLRSGFRMTQRDAGYS
jgi:hypothetical protein